MDDVCFHWCAPARPSRRLFVHACRPDGAPGDLVVLLNPIFDEKKRAQRFQIETARRLAAGSAAAYRIDYFGTGDSAGELWDFDLEESIDDLVAFVTDMTEQRASARIHLVGVRLGADLALLVAQRCPRAGSLYLIEPIVTGARYLTEQRARRQIQQRMHGTQGASTRVNIAGREYEDHQGYLVSPRTADFLERWDATRVVVRDRVISILRVSGHRSTPTQRQLAARLAASNEVRENVIDTPPFWSRLEHVDTRALTDAVVAEIARSAKRSSQSMNPLATRPSRPRIEGAVPGPRARELLRRQSELESSGVSYPRYLPLVPRVARGEWIEDVDGNVLLDLSSMAGSASLGHSPPALKSFRAQSEALIASLDFPTEVRVEFLSAMRDLLAHRVEMDAVLHLTGPTGTNAIEAALKLCRWTTGRRVVLGFQGSYHGMTRGAAAISHTSSPALPPDRRDARLAPYPNCYRCPVGRQRATCALECLAAVERVLADVERAGEAVAAAVIEPVQGEGGTVVPPDEYLKELKGLLQRHGALLVADEVQTGFGRTGRAFAVEWSGVVPDVLVLSKAMSGVGAPLGALAFSRRLNGWPPGSHIGTFRGFLPSLASALDFIAELRGDGLLTHVQLLGREALRRMQRDLMDADRVGDVRGKGLMLGIEFVTDRVSRTPDPQAALRVMRDLFARGVVAELGGTEENVVRLLPPLTISEENLRLGTDMLTECIRSVTHGCRLEPRASGVELEPV